MRSSNTTLQAHQGKLEYMTTIVAGTHHKVIVYKLVGTNTFVYVPSFRRQDTWYAYRVNDESFATFVYENARKMIANKQ